MLVNVPRSQRCQKQLAAVVIDALVGRHHQNSTCCILLECFLITRMCGEGIYKLFKKNQATRK
uniref:Uncharacterized protein n=1 Tax=Lotus japonicus TaxID=34305 RepID=I3T2M6_LOTJA|nr:unknown [Lotus japonicus]